MRIRPIFRIPLLSRHVWRAFTALCLTATVVQAESPNLEIPSPRKPIFVPSLITKPQATTRTTPKQKKPQEIFLFTGTPTENKTKQESDTRANKEQSAPPFLTEPPVMAAPDKQTSHQIFLFTYSPNKNTSTTKPTSPANLKKDPGIHQTINKGDSNLMDATPVSIADIEPVKETIDPEKESEFYFENAPPKGFEYLTAAQTTEVDIYFGNEMILSTMARFDLTSITFIDPQEIVALLPQIKEPAAITSAISGILNPHTEELCLNKLQHNCGILKPNVAEIIFDANRFRVNLFINPLYLNEQTLQSQIFLPTPENSLSSVNIFTARTSGGNTLEQRSYLSSNNIISYGATRLLSQVRLHSDDGLILETARLEHERGKWTYAAGTMESTSYVSSLATTQGFLGLRAARTLNTRTDLRLSSASNIYIFFNERSYVEIIKDGKVFDSGFYEYGNQQLDTSSLPEGVYNITVRISNNRGEELQTHLFSRASILPPQDHALHFLEAGMLLEKNTLGDINKTPKASNVSFVHAGSRMRITDRFGAEIEALNTSEDTTLAQAGLYYFLPGLFFHGGTLGGNNQTQGRFFDLNFSHRLFSLGLSYRDLDTRQVESNSSFQTGTRTTISLGARILGGSLLGRATDNTSIKADTEYSLSYRRSLFRRGSTHAYLTLSWNSSQGDDTMSMGLQLSGSNRQHRETLATRWSDSSGHSTLQTEGSFTRFHQRKGELYGSTTVSALTEKDQQSLGLHIKGDSRYGNGFLKTQHQRYSDSDKDHTTYAAGAQAVMITGASAIALGNSKLGRSGIIVDLNGQCEDDFEVRIDNHTRAIVTTNSNKPMLLPPYQSYDVTLESTGNSLIRFDAKPKTVTLYPGNVTHLQWDVDPVYVVTGQAIYADGKPVENTRITNLEEFSGTDENGWFQVELSKMKALELAPTEGPPCEIQLPEQSEYEEVIVLDQLVCDSKIQTTSRLE